MAYNGGGECRQPKGYSELDGVQVKISEKYRVAMDSAAVVQEEELACMTLNDLHELDKYEYDFTVEKHVVKNFGPLKSNGHHNG